MLVIFVNPQLNTYIKNLCRPIMVKQVKRVNCTEFFGEFEFPCPQNPGLTDPSTQDTEGLKILYICYIHYMFAGLHNTGHIFRPTFFICGKSLPFGNQWSNWLAKIMQVFQKYSVWGLTV